MAMIEPGPRSDTRELLLDYLDAYRATIAEKMRGMPTDELHVSRLPSGWTPMQLLTHLVFMERRWTEWGFAGQDVEDPWGDRRDERWAVPLGMGLADLLDELAERGRRTRRLVRDADLSTPARTGGRFDDGTPPPTLLAILLHMLQEYARHAGHLDIARELADGEVGT